MPDPKAAATVGDVGLVLPHDWWVIPLRPAASRRRSVERLVRRQFTGIDDQPLLRADTARVLLEQADRAASADAQLLALSLLEVAGVPVPASLVVHHLDVPSAPDGVDEHDLLVDLEERLRPEEGSPPAPGFALDRARVSSGPVLRRVHEQRADLEGAEPHPSLVADYWIERPDRSGAVLLAFATPMVALRAGMLELFDAIADALHWTT